MYAPPPPPKLLREKGYGGAVNVRGGLDAWRKDVDPAFPKY